MRYQNKKKSTMIKATQAQLDKITELTGKKPDRLLSKAEASSILSRLMKR